MRKTKTRILSMLLTLAMLLSGIPEALAAEATATALQLTKTTGTVTISNASGRSISLIAKMRLYNGYHVKTGESSYAWITLDSTKLSKLDAVSEMEVRKSGKKLELLLNEGNIYFNVTEPLEDDESLNIRTSTLVVGIRGTCGWVKVVDKWNSVLYILEGVVTVTVTDPVTGQTKTETVRAGECARCVVYPQEQTGDKCDILLDAFSEEDIEGFVLEEAVPDQELCDKIYEASGLDLRGLTEKDAQERLEQDQAEVREKLAEIEEQIAQQDHNISTDPVWEDLVPAAGETESKPVSTPGYTPPAASVMTLVMPQDAATVNGYLSRSDVSGVILQSGVGRSSTAEMLDVDSSITVPAGKRLTLETGVSASVSSVLQIHGTMTVEGGYFSNAGTVNVTGSLTVNGDFNQMGAMTPGSGSVVRATGMYLITAVPGWERSAARDSEGYYRLVPAQSGDGEEEEPTLITGTAGDNITWSYDPATGILRLTGTGPMEDYENSPITFTVNTPWYAYSDEITAVIIEDGITSIGDHAFFAFNALTSVKIPDSVISIGVNSLSSCASLTSVDIPNGVTSIDSSAFSSCTGLASVTIPNSVTSIGDHAFSACFSLTDVTIPNRITSISDYAFYNCTGLTDVTIPASVTSVGDYAFWSCTGLTDVTIPASVTDIGDGAFWGCTSLTDVWYGSTDEDWNKITIGTDNDPLYNATRHNLEVTWRLDKGTLYIEGSGPMEDYYMTGDIPWYLDRDDILAVEIADGVTSIGERAFYACSNLGSVSIAESVTSIGNDAFSGTLTSVVLPQNVTSIGDRAFSGCSNLTSVEIPVSVTSIGDDAFSGCTSLTDVYYGGTEEQWNAIEFGTGNERLSDSNGSESDADAPSSGTTTTIHYSTTRSIVSDAAAGYTDVPAGAWYEEAVYYCLENGLMNGTGAGIFSPDGTLTRAMMVTVLHRLAGTPPAPAAAAFRDVPDGQWYSEAIAWANREGIVFGYDGTTFGLNDPVTHEQVALIFQRYSGDPTVETFGMDTPKVPATRAEIAVTLMHFAQRSTEPVPGTLAVFSAMDILCAPNGIAADADGSLLVTDVYHKQVWRVLERASESYAGGATVLDLYGQPVGGYNDASPENSYFKDPWAIAPFLDGWAVSDAENNVVRLIRAQSVQTVNGATKENLTVSELGVAFEHPTGLAADGDGNLFVSDTFGGAVRKITPEGSVSTVAKDLSEPTGLCWKDGVLYIAETGANRILKLEDGKVSVVAGNGGAELLDGPADEAAFDAPQGVVVGDDGSIYVADTGSGAVRQIKDGVVTTLAVRDPAQAQSGLTTPTGLLLLDGKLYICDPFARKVFVYYL